MTDSDLEPLPETNITPTLLDTVRYAAAMWEFQLLHFDPDRAHIEGLAGPIVQGPLLGVYLAHAVEAAIPADAELAELSWRNRAVVPVGTTLHIGGTARTPDACGCRDLELWIRNDADVEVVTGNARIRCREALA